MKVKTKPGPRKTVTTGPKAAMDDAGSPAAVTSIGTEPDSVEEVPPAGFSAEIYLIVNPDVKASVEAGITRSAFWHWVNYGKAEERSGARPTITSDIYYGAPARDLQPPPTQGELDRFDAREYLAANPDVANGLHGNPAGALDHWINHGRFESRSATLTSLKAPRKTHPFRLMERPFGINIFAPFSAQSGLGTVARGNAQALIEADIPVHLVNVDTSRGHARVASRDLLERPPYRINLLQVNADSLERFIRIFPEGWLDDAYNIATWAWELNVLRPDWYLAFQDIDEVWAPSDYTAAAIRAIAPVPVHTINYAVTEVDTSAFSRQSFNLPDGFLFLIAFDVGSSLVRKNPEAVIDAFLAAFADRTDVFLVMKFHSGRHYVNDVRRLLTRTRHVPNILVRSEMLTNDEMRGLQACCDCLVSAHRSEGFGLNIAEFMLTGKPVIATDYSGNTAFTTAENSFPIAASLCPVESASGPYFPGYLWAEPDPASLQQQMQRVVADPGHAAEIGRRGAETIRAGFSLAKLGTAIAGHIAALGLQAPIPAFLSLLGKSATIALPPGGLSLLSDPRQIAARPTLSVIVPVYNVAPEYLLACIESVRNQTYPHWELCLCDDASTSPGTIKALETVRGIDPRIRVMRLAVNEGISGASNGAVTMATGSYVVMLDNDDVLTTDALQEIASHVARDPTIDVLYSDEDKLDSNGRRTDSYFKPDWSPEHLESVMYTLHPVTVRTSLFLEIGGFRKEYSGAQDWDLMLRLSRRTKAITHIPKILYHWRMIPGSASSEIMAKPDAIDAGLRVLTDHVAEKYGPGRARAERGILTGHYRVRHTIIGDPVVTLCILTHNTEITLPGRERFVMVENLVRSIIEKTKGVRYKIMVVDDCNTKTAQAEWMLDNGVIMHHYERPGLTFNFSDKANFSIACTNTENLVLMNDDIEVINEEWLSAMVEYSQLPDVGACCGKLLHDDGTIQHVGTVLGVNDGSAHVYHGFPGDMVGYNGYTHLIRNYSALTAACLATRRSVLDEIGPWDTKLAIDYNDVDLCLRMGQHGYRLVYTPYSEAYHFESKSAVRNSANPDEVALFRRRWSHIVANDPFYNPNLSRTRLDFAER